MNETTNAKKITRAELYSKFPYLENISIKDMIQLVAMCFQCNSDDDLVYAIKCYMHSYPELQREENLNRVYKLTDE